ncbi:MAG: alkaline phosphatase family protein [Candidatus Binatia bacterium]
MPAPTSKIIVIGIDAANPVLIRRWAEEGLLPNLRSLMARGLVGATRSVEGFFIGSTWPSFYTGLTPARHGFHYFIQLKPGTYNLYRPADEGIVPRDPFWTHLSRAGRRVAILDVPLTRIDPSINGIQVVEWGGHDSVYGFQASSPALLQTIKSRCGEYPLGASCDREHRTAADYQAFTEVLLKGTRLKADLTKHFLSHGDWDFFMQVFTEAHCAGHQCWHLHDDTHPAHDRSIVWVTGDPLLKVYAAIDSAIGELLDSAGDTLVMVVAAHGMSYWYGAQFLLEDILFRLGVARPPARGLAREGLSSAMTGARWVWRRLPPPIKRLLQPLRRRLLQETTPAGRLPAINADLRTSYCFPVRNGLAISGIRLNLSGREPSGILEPSQADEFCKNLSTDLLSIVDERTETPLVRRVLRTADLYHGERLDHLPDLLIEWNDEVPTGSTTVGTGNAATVRARSPKIGLIEGVNHYGRTGEHRPEGLFIAAGPGVRPGMLEREISILDFAPTFGRLLGVELPDCDGRPVNELLRNS